MPAAGRGRRLGAPVNKTFLELDGVPVLAHTLKALQSAETVGIQRIIVALGPNDFELYYEKISPHLRPVPEVSLVLGGDDRQGSVKNALDQVDPEAELVLVHDGARPLVSLALIKRCIDVAQEQGNAVAAIPVADTVKMVDETGRVIETPPRDKLWRVQTPQVFRREILVAAHEHALNTGYLGTDDASLVERIGEPVYVVMGDERNFKITTPADLIIAAALIRSDVIR